MGNLVSKRRNYEKVNSTDLSLFKDDFMWIKTSEKLQYDHYLTTNDSYWKEYSEPRDFMKKIQKSLFGKISEIDADQMGAVRRIYEKIMKIHSKSGLNKLTARIILISCKNDSKTLVTPVFGVKIKKSNDDQAKFVDVRSRVYRDWTDWEENSQLIGLKLCYPVAGVYSCSEKALDFDPNALPRLIYTRNQSRNGLDTIFLATSLISGFGLLKPGLSSRFLAICSIFGGLSAIYGTCMSINHLCDKKAHEESIKDLESLSSWLSIFIIPLHFGSPIIENLITKEAGNAKILNSRLLITINSINLSILAIEIGSMTVGLMNILKKLKNTQPTKLDLLQFSISSFFFSQSLIQWRSTKYS